MRKGEDEAPTTAPAKPRNNLGAPFDFSNLRRPRSTPGDGNGLYPLVSGLLSGGRQVSQTEPQIIDAHVTVAPAPAPRPAPSSVVNGSVHPPSMNDSGPSWGKPSKKWSLEDDVPDDEQKRASDILLNPPSSTTRMGSQGSVERQPNSRLPTTDSQSKNTGDGNEAIGITSAASQSISSHSASDGRSNVSRLRNDSVSSEPARSKSTSLTGDRTREMRRSESTPVSREDEEKQLLAAIEASNQEYQQSQVIHHLMNDEALEEAKGYARSLREAVSTEGADIDLLQGLIKTCQTEKEKVERSIQTLVEKNENVNNFIDVLDILLKSKSDGEEAVKVLQEAIVAADDGGGKPTSQDRGTSSFSVSVLAENGDVFTLLCYLRAQDKQMDAAFALMNFARDAKKGCDKSVKLREDMRSSGGITSLISLFRQKSSHDLKATCALTIAYMLESAISIPDIQALVIVSSLRFLSRCQDIRLGQEYIAKSEIIDAVTDSLTAFWLNYITPKLQTEGMQSTNGDRSQSSELSLRRSRTNRPVDQRRDLALKELTEMTVPLIVFVARDLEQKPASMPALVEHVCVIEYARPLIVREGILQVLVAWLGMSKEYVSAACIALRYLTSTKDRYMAGWIHSEMVNKAVVREIVGLTRKGMSASLRAEVAKILSSLCVAPHTRAAVVQSNAMSFLVGILYDTANPNESELVVAVMSALVQLLTGAITRTNALGFDDVEASSISPDKGHTVIKTILEAGAIEPIVSLAKSSSGKHRVLAVEALRVLSEDVHNSTRFLLCNRGAASALGLALRDLSSSVPSDRALDRAFMSFGKDPLRLKGLQHAVYALANILDPYQKDEKRFFRRESLNITEEISSDIEQGCIDTARDGGLESILKIATLRLGTGSSVRDGVGSNGNVSGVASLVFEEACRSLSSLAPLLLRKRVAQKQLEIGACEVFEALHGVLCQLYPDCEKGKAAQGSSIIRMDDVKNSVLQGLAALATAGPFKTRIIGHTLKPLLRSVQTSEEGGPSNTVSQAFQQIDLMEDDDALIVAGNEPSFIADWFCLQRLLLVQSMARDEIRRVLEHIWEEKSVQIFESFADDSHLSTTKQDLVEQNYDFFGGKDSVKDDFSHECLLSGQVFPMCSGATETKWILGHRQYMRTALKGAVGGLVSPHVNKLLDSLFPSQLLRDQVLPISACDQTSSFNFRALVMPEKAYMSFARETKLLAKIYEKESSESDSNIHWTVGFRNSSFGGEFAEYFVEFLYLRPNINGLSFFNDGRPEKNKTNTIKEDKSDVSLLAGVAGSSPPWITHITFDGVLKETDLATLVSILENVGTLSSSNGEAQAASDSQGRFSFLAIRRSPFVSSFVWDSFFGLFSNSSSAASVRPLSSLLSLDLSSNALGDELCGKLIRTLYLDGSKCRLEELDLSGNEINNGTHFVRELKRIEKHTIPLHTLNLSSNKLVDAWHAIVTSLQLCAPTMRALDLSNNEIVLNDLPKFDTIVNLTKRNKGLVRLNLGKNFIDPRLFRASELEPCSLSFLDLEGNAPPFTEDQMSPISAFLAANRRSLLSNKTTTPRPPPPPVVEPEEVQQPEIPPKLTTESSSQETGKPPLNEGISVISEDNMLDVTDNSITVLFSAPLVYKGVEGGIRAFAKLNFEKERIMIWDCLRDAGRDIELNFDTATNDRLLAAFAKKSSCLHYSGHGHEEYLPFEDGSGGPKWFPVNEFKQIIERAGGKAPFRFVFVSACHSGLAGRMFADAGVPHVVCCQQDFELKDNAALAFTRQFYYALAVGNTVKESFEQGCRSVRAAPNLPNAEQEMRKFVLLPEDGDHDVPVFRAPAVPEWPRSLSEETRRQRLRRTSQNAVKAFELSLKNLLQEDPAPAPPQFFLGREVEMYKVVSQILGERRVVSVIGESGIGRSSLVAAVCHYINERKTTVITVVEKIYYVRAKEYKNKNRFMALLKSLKKLLVEDNLLSGTDDDDDMIETVCCGLRSKKALVVFDRIELLEDVDELNEFPRLIQELYRSTRYVKILLTNRRPLGIPSLGEYHVKLGPLNLVNTVKLYAFTCHFIVTPSDRRQLQQSLVSDEETGSLLPGPDIPEDIAELFDMLGKGIPSRIENAAFCVHKDTLRRMKDGTWQDID